LSELKVEYVETTTLIPYALNSRTHSDSQVAQIAASIKEFGFTNPILVDDTNTIIAGHGRIMAAGVLGLETVPTIALRGLSDAQRKAYVIADNKLALNAGWDPENLRVEMEALNELDFDLALIGFDAIELGKIFDDEPMPELRDEEYNEAFSVIVECKDEAEQEQIFNRLDAEGYKCRVQSL